MSNRRILKELGPVRHPYFNGSSKPYVRWWWLAGPFYEEDIVEQLDWIANNGFGGVEIAWLAPHWLGQHVPPPQWLSPEWSKLVKTTIRLIDERNLGCDFTFGSCWPFGGGHVKSDFSAQTFDGLSDERLQGSWEDYQHTVCRVLNHLSRQALQQYAIPLLDAMESALMPHRTALFCDSLEIETKKLWDVDLWDIFESRFGYRLEPFSVSLKSHPDVRYDYRKLIAETMTREFYASFTDICHEARTYSRVQCHGSPTDLLSSYGSVDIPESETLLFNPHFSRIPASAAALTGKPVVSAETFTCMYGFSRFRDPALYRRWRNEDIHDLRLLADAVIANGVNQIVWHGMPYNPPGGDNEFFAAVHVGPDSGFAESLPAFNRYLSSLCGVMQCNLVPFISGNIIPFYWAREVDDAVYVFLAHPETRNISFPMQYKQSRRATAKIVSLQFHWHGRHHHNIDVPFKDYSSTMLRLEDNGRYRYIDLQYGDLLMSQSDVHD